MMRTWDGQGWRPFEPGDIAPDDRGFLLGDGVFETMRLAGGRIRYSAAHRARFEAACAALDLVSPAPWPAVEAEAAGLPDCATLRLTLTRGAAPRGIGPVDRPAPRLFLAKFAPKADAASVALHVSAIRRSPASPACRHKTLSYADNAAARREAVAAGADMALLLTADGHVSGADCANVFWLCGGTVFTPSTDCAIRAGVMREAVLAAAVRAGLEVSEGRFEPGMLSSASAIFVTNAAMGVVPVHALDGGAVETGHPAVPALRQAVATGG